MSDAENPKKKEPLWQRLVYIIFDKLLIAGAILYLTHNLTTKRETAINTLETKSKVFIDSLGTLNQLALKSKDSIHNLQMEAVKTANQSHIDSVSSALELQTQTIRLQTELANSLTALNKKFEDALEVERQKVNFDAIRNVNKTKLELVQNRLSDFYWPVLTRMDKSRAISKAYKKNFLLNEIEQQVLVNNHTEVLQRIENFKHLIYTDEYLDEEIKHYVAYVSLFQTMQESGFPGDPSKIGGNSFREQFYKMLKARTDYYQTQYNELLKVNTGNDSSEYHLDDFPYETQYRNQDINLDSVSLINEPNELRYDFKKYFIPQANDERSFNVPLDDSIAVFLKNSELYENAFIEVSFFVKNQTIKEEKRRKKNKRIVKVRQLRENPVYSQKLEIGEDAAFYFPSLGNYYRIQLNRVYKDSGRQYVDITVHKWCEAEGACKLKKSP